MSDERLPNGMKPEWAAMLSEASRRSEAAAAYAESQPLQPPWVTLPYNRTSMGWRMGAGEDVMDAFRRRFRSLSPEDRKLFVQQFAEPDGWEGFYASL